MKKRFVRERLLRRLHVIVSYPVRFIISILPFVITAEILAHSFANFMSITGQTHEFLIHAMRHRIKADNLTIYYRKKKQIVQQTSFSCVCPVIDN